MPLRRISFCSRGNPRFVVSSGVSVNLLYTLNVVEDMHSSVVDVYLPAGRKLCKVTTGSENKKTGFLFFGQLKNLK